MNFVLWALVVCLFATAAARVLDEKEVSKLQNELDGIDKLNLEKPVGSVLHHGIKVVTVDEDSKTGKIVFNAWQSTQQEIENAENVFVDQENLAVVRAQENNGNISLTGVVNGKNIFEAEDSTIYTDINQPQAHFDFIDNPINLTYSLHRSTKAVPSFVVETLVICDKELGDKFQHDRVKILDYLTVYFWDINMRYKTLPSVDISFRVTGVVVISTPGGQPFIEDARAPDGRAEFGRILNLFTGWVYNNQASFPKFDLAILLTNTNLEWGGGLAYLRHTCRNAGSAVFSDNGEWGSNTIGTHEIGHTLGAPHDEADPDCPARGYIMSGAQDHLRWFFSDCSDRHITGFVTSDQAACLRRIDEPGLNPISPDFSFIRPPSMEEQCKMRLGPDAWISESDTADCKRLRCRVGQGNPWELEFPDNSPCRGGGRCFRGHCRNPDYRVVNVGSGQCLKAPNQFAFTVAIQMVPCPQPGTPLDRFAVTDKSSGKTLGTPWQTLDALENGDRCIYTGNSEGGGLWTDKCGDNPWHGWDFIDVGNSEFLLSHRLTTRCVKQVGNGVQVFQNCDRNDRNMRWKLM